MWNKTYDFCKLYFPLGFFVALITITSRYWYPIVEGFNPISTPHQNWTDLHHLVALLIGMVVFVGISTLGLSLSKIFKKIDVSLAEQERIYGENLSKRRTVVKVSFIISALTTGVLGLAGIGIFGYQILNHPTFGMIVQVSLVIITGLAISGFGVFVVSFWLPNAIYSIFNGSFKKLNHKLLDCLIADLKEDLQNLINEMQSLDRHEQSIKTKYIVLKQQVKSLQSQSEIDLDEDVRCKVSYDKQVALERADDYKNKLTELTSLQFKQHDKINQVKSKIAFAKMQKEIIESQNDINEVISYLESKGDDNEFISIKSAYQVNIKTFNRIRAQIKSSLSDASTAVNENNKLGSTEEVVSLMKDAFLRTQRAARAGLALKKFMQEEKQIAKFYAKQLLQSIDDLNELLSSVEDKGERKAKFKEKYRFYLNMAVRYQEALEELNRVLLTLKNKQAILQHQLPLASANQDIRKSKKVSRISK